MRPRLKIKQNLHGTLFVPYKEMAFPHPVGLEMLEIQIIHGYYSRLGSTIKKLGFELGTMNGNKKKETITT
jgi:hypothetical protein